MNMVMNHRVMYKAGNILITSRRRTLLHVDRNDPLDRRDPLTEHEERRREVDPDELDAQIHGNAEGCSSAHARGDVPQQAEPGLGADPVRHPARRHRECGHDEERGAEVRNHGPRVALQLVVQGSTREPGR